VVFENSKEMIFEACRIWQKSNVAKGISEYYANFEDFSKRHIEDEIEDYQKAIASLKQRSEMLKKEIKKDKEKKATLDEVMKHLKTAAGDLKAKKKELESLPQHIKQLKATFQDQMKDLSRVIDDVAKIKTQELKSEKIGATLQKMKELVSRFNEINEIANLDEIIKAASIEFKLENENGQKKVKDYKKLMILLEESIGAQCFDLSENEKIGSKKAEYLKNACAEFTIAANDSKEDNFDVDYYSGLLALAQGLLIISFGIQKMEDYECALATRYFLQARELLVSIKTGLNLDNLITERVALTRAMASDAFSTIYLLNSYDNWKNIDASTTDPELKEIAGISTRNIEEWIIKQYGFPSEEKIAKILNAMIWPKPLMPPELESYVPKNIVKELKARAKTTKNKSAEPKNKGKVKKQPKNRQSKKKSADLPLEQEANVEPSGESAVEDAGLDNTPATKPTKQLKAKGSKKKSPAREAAPVDEQAEELPAAASETAAEQVDETEDVGRKPVKKQVTKTKATAQKASRVGKKSATHSHDGRN